MDSGGVPDLVRAETGGALVGASLTGGRDDTGGVNLGAANECERDESGGELVGGGVGCDPDDTGPVCEGGGGGTRTSGGRGTGVAEGVDGRCDTGGFESILGAGWLRGGGVFRSFALALGRTGGVSTDTVNASSASSRESGRFEIGGRSDVAALSLDVLVYTPLVGRGRCDRGDPPVSSRSATIEYVVPADGARFEGGGFASRSVVFSLTGVLDRGGKESDRSSDDFLRPAISPLHVVLFAASTCSPAPACSGIRCGECVFEALSSSRSCRSCSRRCSSSRGAHM